MPTPYAPSRDDNTTVFDVHSPWCEVPTGKTGSVTTSCGQGAIVRDASICGAMKPCAVHGGEWPAEDDVPIEVRRELLKAATDKQISYYYLTAIYRKGRQATPAPSLASSREAIIAEALESVWRFHWAMEKHARDDFRDAMTRLRAALVSAPSGKPASRWDCRKCGGERMKDDQFPASVVGATLDIGPFCRHCWEDVKAKVRAVDAENAAASAPSAPEREQEIAATNEPRRRACECAEPDPVMQADGKFYCYGCSFETGAHPQGLEPEDIARRAIAASPAPQGGNRKEWAVRYAVDRIVGAVAELPDRTSPDEWPDAMLVTADELRAIVDAEIRALLVPPPSSQEPTP